MLKLITAGIDLGASFAKMVILKDGKEIGRGLAAVTLEQEEAIINVKKAALENAKIEEKDIDRIGVTGSGRALLEGADLYTTDVTADAAGVNYVNKAVRTLIDIGGEEARAIKVNAEGKVINFAVNDKCAAGAGAFTETMARAMQLSLAEFAQASLKSTQRIPINAQCVIFAESEVVGLVSDETPREDICRAVHDGIAERIISMSKRVGIEEKVGLMGGAVQNVGLVKSLEDGLGMDIEVLPDPQFISALGIALLTEKE